VNRHTDVMRLAKPSVFLVMLVAALLGAGCDGSSAAKTSREQMQRARTLWNRERPAAYALRTHLVQTFGFPPRGDYLIRVSGRRVTGVQRADGTRLKLGPEWTDFSVDGTFDVLASLLRPREASSATVAVTYDDRLGCPRRIDVRSKAVDGGWSARLELLRE
jgi:hypothetical protein